MVKDPVCGMTVDPKKVKFTITKEGKKYYFCSKQCFQKFSNPKEKPHKHVSESSTKASLKIQGMTCASCAGTIETALKNSKGVKDARVNFASERCEIEFDETTTSTEKLTQVIKESGYTSTDENREDAEFKVLGMGSSECPERIIGNVASAVNIKYFYSPFCLSCWKQEKILSKLIDEKGDLFFLERYDVRYCSNIALELGVGVP